VLENIPTLVTQEKNEKLMMEIIEREIQIVVSSLYLDKILRPNRSQGCHLVDQYLIMFIHKGGF
jgi:hypothetical protein